MFIFLDESGGSTGFDASGSLKSGASKTFNIAILCCDSTDDVKRVVKSFEKKLIRRKGWPKEIEIKGANLFAAQYRDDIPANYKFKNSPSVPIIEILQKLCTCNIEIDYIVVQKEHLSEALKAAPFGIIYNYLAWRVLEGRLKDAVSATLIIDAQNKEIHAGKHFDGYIQTQAFQNIETLRSLNIQHLDSANDYRIRAVDFVSWAIFRKYEHGDSTFFDEIKNRVTAKNAQAWFFR